MSQRRSHNGNQKIFLINYNEDMAYSNFQDATKALLKENVQQVYMLKKEECLKITVLSIHFKKLEKRIENKTQKK